MSKRPRPIAFDLDAEEDAPRDDLRSRLHLGTLKIDGNVYFNVKNGQFDVSVLAGVQLHKVTFRGHMLNQEEFDLENHRKRLETCSEIEKTLSNESIHVIQCYGYVAKQDNVRKIFRCSEATIIRFDEIMEIKNSLQGSDNFGRQGQPRPDAQSLKGKLLEDMWNAYDYFARRSYFLDVDLFGLYLGMSYSFTVGDLSQIKPLTANSDFKEVLKEISTPIEQLPFSSMRMFKYGVKRINRRSRLPEHHLEDMQKYDRPPSESINRQSFYEDMTNFLDHKHKKSLWKPKPLLWDPYEPRDLFQYKQLDGKLTRAVLRFSHYCKEEAEYERSDSFDAPGRGFLSEVSRVLAEIIDDAAESVEAHINKWNLTVERKERRRMIRDSAFWALVPLIDQELKKLEAEILAQNRDELRKPLSSEEEQDVWNMITQKFFKSDFYPEAQLFGPIAPFDCNAECSNREYVESDSDENSCNSEDSLWDNDDEEEEDEDEEEEEDY